MCSQGLEHCLSMCNKGRSKMQHTSAVPREHEVGTESVWDILMHDAPTGASIPNNLSAIVLTVHHAVGSIQGCSSRGTVLHVSGRKGERGKCLCATGLLPFGVLWLSKGTRTCMKQQCVTVLHTQSKTKAFPRLFCMQVGSWMMLHRVCWLQLGSN